MTANRESFERIRAEQERVEEEAREDALIARYEERRTASQRRRAHNRGRSAKILEQNGIDFESKSGGGCT